MIGNREEVIFHTLVVVLVYGIYAAYPPYQIPIPYFGMTSVLGIIYAFWGLIRISDMKKVPDRSHLRMGLFYIFVGALLFLSEPWGNIYTPNEYAQAMKSHQERQALQARE